MALVLTSASFLSLLEHLFLRAFWQTMIREWVGIDRLRLDKFYMVRQRGTLGWRSRQGLVWNLHIA